MSEIFYSPRNGRDYPAVVDYELIAWYESCPAWVRDKEVTYHAEKLLELEAARLDHLLYGKGSPAQNQWDFIPAKLFTGYLTHMIIEFGKPETKRIYETLVWPRLHAAPLKTKAGPK